MKTKKFFSKSTAFAGAFIITQVMGGYLCMPQVTQADTSLQGQIDSDNQQIAKLNQQIAQYQAAIKAAGANKKTLQAALQSLDLKRSAVQAQVAATQSQINATQLQIQQLTGQIANTKDLISQYQDALGNYIQDVQRSDQQSPVVELLSANSLSDFWQSHDANVQVQSAIQQKTQELNAQETTLTNTETAVQQQQDALTAQNKSLTSQQQSLTATVAQKNELLTETNNKESNYEKLLAQAQAQLNSFSNFTKNAGGVALLRNQTVCDSWGCYYNQRDVAWGGLALDGTNYSIASDGCLVTAMAMVMTHYGYSDVTPATINANPDNFASYYPAYLLTTISVDGVSATRKSTTIDATLATGTPVIIGMNAYGGTHFVVLISGSNGNYVMRDPYVASGKDIKFSSHYTMKEIYSIAKVVIN